MSTFPTTKRNNPSLAARLDALESQGVGVSLFTDQAPATGAINGSNQHFTVSQGKYVPGTLKVFLNGQYKTHTDDYTETDPTTGVFDTIFVPQTGDKLRLEYQYVTSATGNADTLDGYHADPAAVAGKILPLNGFGDFVLANAAKYSWKNLAGAQDGYIREDSNENLVHNIATGKKHSFMVNGAEVFSLDVNAKWSTWTSALFSNDGVTPIGGIIRLSRFSMSGKTVNYDFVADNIGDPAGARIYFTLPVPPKGDATYNRNVGNGWADHYYGATSHYLTVPVILLNAQTHPGIQMPDGTTAWNPGGGHRVWVSGSYESA